MDSHVLLQILIPAVGLISGLIGAYVGLENRLLLAEVRKEMAEMENRLADRLNGKYVRAAECSLRESLLQERIATILEEVRSRNAAGD